MDLLGAIVTANLVGIGSNFDNSGVGIAYGTARIRFPHRINALVNLIGCLSSLLGAYAGETLSRIIPPPLGRWASCGLFVAMGLGYIYSVYMRPKKNGGVRKPPLHRLGWQQGIVLGLGLSFTNVVSGFGATVADTTQLWALVLSITAWGYLAIWLGNILGMGIIARLLGTYSPLVAGLALIGVGVYQALH
ncbi:manganese efflux pump MntP [Streptomyces halstedii]|uniref:manganese efflux pump MntP n=1 Tax=Streptomyces halstedii TaxID=1944 RepID=UPI00367CA432